MDHCTIRASCDACVSDEACYWVTLANKTLMCSQDLVRMGLDYLGSIEKSDGCVKVTPPGDTLVTATTVGIVTGAVAITAGIFGVGWWIKRCQNRNCTRQPRRQLEFNNDRQCLFGPRELPRDRDLFIGPNGQSISPFWGNTRNSGIGGERSGVELTSFLPKRQDTSQIVTIQPRESQANVLSRRPAVKHDVAADTHVNGNKMNDKDTIIEERFPDVGPTASCSIAPQAPQPDVQALIRTKNSVDTAYGWHRQATQLNNINIVEDGPVCYSEQITTRLATIKLTETKEK